MGIFGKKKAESSSLPDLDESAFSRIISGNERVVVDCWNTHCAPCRKVHPIMEELAGKYPYVSFAKLNTDEYVSIAVEHGVMSVPTILFFRNGRLAGSLAGTTSRSEIESALKEKLEV